MNKGLEKRQMSPTKPITTQSWWWLLIALFLCGCASPQSLIYQLVDNEALVVVNPRTGSIAPFRPAKAKFFVMCSSDAFYEVFDKDDEGRIYIAQPEIEKALHTPECRPARLDPAGHWGADSGILQLSLRFSTNVFQEGEPIIATVLVRDLMAVSTTFRGADYVSGPRFVVIDTKTGQRLAKRPSENPIVDRLRYSSPGKYSRPIYPGTQMKFELHLENAFALGPGKYYVYATGHIPSIDGVASPHAPFEVNSGKVLIIILPKPDK